MTEENSSEDSIPGFSALTQGMFGPMESTVGTDQYNANVENTKSCTEGNKALTELMRARVKQRDAIAAAVYVLIFMSFPVYIVLLIWLIKTLVV